MILSSLLSYFTVNMLSSKLSRKNPSKPVLAARDLREQPVNGNAQRGTKRARVLQETTNINLKEKVNKKKKKKPTEEDKENIPPEKLVVVWSSQEAVKPRRQPVALYACDSEKYKSNGHLFSSDYLHSIIRAMNSNEEKSTSLFPNPNYFDGQSDLRPHMRTVLFTWLCEVHMKFKLREVVLWATFQICDRFLSKARVLRKNLQLVGCASLWIACKYHEIYAPMGQDLVHISDKAFTKSCLLSMECKICEALDYQFSIPNAFQFLDRYTEVAVGSIKEARLKNRVKWLARYGMERFHMQVKALKYTPSMLAAGALFAALKLTAHKWTGLCQACSGYTANQLLWKNGEGELSIFREIKMSIMDFDLKAHKAIILKYKAQERGCVSTLRKKEDNAVRTRPS